MSKYSINIISQYLLAAVAKKVGQGYQSRVCCPEFFERMPLEIFDTHLVPYLDFKDILNLRLVNRFFYDTMDQLYDLFIKRLNRKLIREVRDILKEYYLDEFDQLINVEHIFGMHKPQNVFYNNSRDDPKYHPNRFKEMCKVKDHLEKGRDLWEELGLASIDPNIEMKVWDNPLIDIDDKMDHITQDEINQKRDSMTYHRNPDKQMERRVDINIHTTSDYSIKYLCFIEQRARELEERNFEGKEEFQYYVPYDVQYEESFEEMSRRRDEAIDLQKLNQRTEEQQKEIEERLKEFVLPEYETLDQLVPGKWMRLKELIDFFNNGKIKFYYSESDFGKKLEYGQNIRSRYTLYFETFDVESFREYSSKFDDEGKLIDDSYRLLATNDNRWRISEVMPTDPI